MKIMSADGKERDIDCIGCALQRNDIESLGERIIETDNFVVMQDYEIPIPGFMVLSSKRHIASILDFNDEEESEFYGLVKKVRIAMKEALRIKHVMLFCNESKIISNTNPSHFHFCFLPKDGFESKNLNETLEYFRENMKTEENLKKVKDSAIKVKEYLRNLVNSSLGNNTMKCAKPSEYFNVRNKF
jgi:diadenosine tetraphosphate (Ap4A) HIT family hydrolase